MCITHLKFKCITFNVYKKNMVIIIKYVYFQRLLKDILYLNHYVLMELGYSLFNNII